MQIPFYIFYFFFLYENAKIFYQMLKCEKYFSHFILFCLFFYKQTRNINAFFYNEKK